MALQATGYPIGATLGGLMAAWLLTRHGWRSVFVFGGVSTALMVPIVLWKLPESVDFLLARRPWHALEKLNRLLGWMGPPTVTRLPERMPEQTVHGGTVMALFRGGLACQTGMLWAGFFLLMFSVYFSLSWTPRLLMQAGLSMQQGITGGALLNLGGMVGGALFGVLALRLRRLAVASLLLHALFMRWFGAVSTSLSQAFAAAFGLGGPVRLYGRSLRTGSGDLSVSGSRHRHGVGDWYGPLRRRCRADSGRPLLDSGWQPSTRYYAFALPLMAVGVVVVGFRRVTPGGVSPLATY